MKLAKTLLAALWVVGVTLASAAAYADPPYVVGRLNYISGPVSFAPAQADEDWVAATLNRPITTGDRLWTDNNAFAEMHVGSLAVRMAPQTSMDVLNLDDRALQLRVAQGDVNLRVRRLSSGRLIEIATPNGAVVLRQPGSYRISVDGDSSIVTVRAGGQAEVFTAGSSVLVRDAEEVEILRSRPELFAASQPDDFDRWAADRDRRQDRVVSTRYVPVEMTGYEDLDQYGEWRTVADYGNVWIPSSVPTGWAPYRYGHWVWISPWGWTWVDDQPWGFAPSHYGRWVWYDNYWAWAPGRLVERPVYSPALVAFIGGSNFSVSIGVGRGPAVAWVPLGYREPYIPWYSASPMYVQNVNITHVTNVTNITNTTNIQYVNRTAPAAVTVVSRDNFVAARPVQQAAITVPSRTLTAAPVTQVAPVSQPARTSFARQEPGSRPPAQVIAREAVVVNRPPAPAREVVRESRDDRRAPQIAASPERLPVRVIERRERVNLPVNEAPRAEARVVRPAIQAPRADAPAEPQRPPQAVQDQRGRDLQSRQQEQAREQQGERLREQKKQDEQQQKAQAQQQADQLERERKQRAGQEEQAREQQRAHQEQQRQQQAVQEQQQRAQQEQQRQQQAAQQQAQKAQQEQQRAQQAAQRAQQDAQRAQQEQQRAQQEQQRAQQAAQRAQQDAQRAQQEQQLHRQQQAAQQAQQALQEQHRAQQEQQRAQQDQQRAQQDQQRAQQAAQKAQQDAQRAQQEQQRQQQAAQLQARAQQQRAQPQRPAEPQAAPQEPQEKGRGERGRKDQSAKD